MYHIYVCTVDIHFQLFLNIYFANFDSLSNLLIVLHFPYFVSSMYVCMYVCVCVCMYVCNVCMYACNICMCVFVCMYVCVCVCVCVCLYVCVYMYFVCAYVCMCICVCVCVSAYASISCVQKLVRSKVVIFFSP